MGDDTRKVLQKISYEVQAVGRSIGSPKTDIEGLMDLHSALKHHAKTLKIYAKIEKDRLEV